MSNARADWAQSLTHQLTDAHRSTPQPLCSSLFPNYVRLYRKRMVDDISSSNNNNRERLRTYSNAFLSRYSASTPCFCMHDTLPVDLPDLYPSDTLILGLSILTLGIFTTHTRLTALFPGLPSCAGTRKVKPIWILLKQETVSGSGISWAICMSAPCSGQTTTPAPNHSVFYRPDAQPTASKH